MSFRDRIKGGILIGLTSCLLCTCSGTERVKHPVFPDGGLLKQATALPALVLARFDGVYAAKVGQNRFGNLVVGSSTNQTFSVFSNKNEAYAVMRGGCLDEGQSLVFEGYWRYANRTDTGLIRLFAGPDTLVKELCAGKETTGTIELTGSIGSGDELPSEGVAFGWQSKTQQTPERPFKVVAHRGGCRTSDDCGASENSVEVIRLAESLGAGSVEVDVRITADGVPILYHDEDFNPRLTTGEYCHGPVGEFTFKHVRALCQLTYGEAVPTLEGALRVAMDETTLRGVWLDIKNPETVVAAVEVAKKIAKEAKAKGRKISIVTGLGDQGIYDTFMGAGYGGQVPCLVELEAEDVIQAGCKVFAPRWTRGPMADTVNQLQSSGHLVAFWTLDEVDFIDLFLRSITPNGILTNRPGLVAHRFEMVGRLPPAAEEP